MNDKINKQANKLSIIIFKDYSYVFGMFNFDDKGQIFLIEIGYQVRQSMINQQHDWGQIDYSKQGKMIEKEIMNVIPIDELDELNSFATFFKSQNNKY